jgi:hypothetical protein
MTVRDLHLTDPSRPPGSGRGLITQAANPGAAFLDHFDLGLADERAGRVDESLLASLALDELHSRSRWS